MFQSAFNNLHKPCNSSNTDLIKLGNTASNNIRFGLKRKINILKYLIASNVSICEKNHYNHIKYLK